MPSPNRLRLALRALSALGMLAVLGLTGNLLLGRYRESQGQVPASTARPGVVGDRYAFDEPAGWLDRTAELGAQFASPGSQVLHVLARRGGAGGGFVLVQRASSPDSAKALRGSAEQVVRGLRGQGGGAELRGRPRDTRLAGAPAVAFDVRIGGLPVELRAAGVNAARPGEFYTILATAPAAGFGPAGQALAQVTGSWSWR